MQCGCGVDTNFEKLSLLQRSCFIVIILRSDLLYWCPGFCRHIWFCLINTPSFFFSFFFTSDINKTLPVKYSRLLAQSKPNWQRVRKGWDKHVRLSLTHLACCIFRCADAYVYLLQADWHQDCAPNSPVSVTLGRHLNLTHSLFLCMPLWLTYREQPFLELFSN